MKILLAFCLSMSPAWFFAQTAPQDVPANELEMATNIDSATESSDVDANADHVAPAAAPAPDTADLLPPQSWQFVQGKCHRKSWIAIVAGIDDPPTQRFRCTMVQISHLARRPDSPDTVIGFYAKGYKAVRVQYWGVWESRHRIAIKFAQLQLPDRKSDPVQGFCVGDFHRPPEAFFAEGETPLDIVTAYMDDADEGQKRDAERVQYTCDISDMQGRPIASMRFPR